MKKNSIILISIAAIVIILVFAGISKYNTLVNMEEDVKGQWANVETQYQRRANLIPNLVATVKGYASHESTTLEAVTAARSKATQITIDPSKISAEKLQQFQAAQGEISTALGKLVMLQEKYPDLKANENFKDLQNQLERTENRIAVERTNFNAVAKIYNSAIRKFPTNIVASFGHFEQKPYFEADKSAASAPEVKF